MNREAAAYWIPRFRCSLMQAGLKQIIHVVSILAVIFSVAFVCSSTRAEPIGQLLTPAPPNQGSLRPDDAVSGFGFLGIPSTDTSVVEIKANGVHLAIPRNYLDSAALQSRYGAFFNIVTTIPDFAGATDATLEQFRAPNWWKYPNTLRMIYTSGMDQDHDRSERTSKGAAEGELEDADFGLQLAKRWQFIDIFVNVEEKISIECENSTLISPNTNKCRVWIPVAGGRLTLQCEYLRDQLKNWRVINDGIHALLNRFIVGGDKP